MPARHPNTNLERFFSGVTEYTFEVKLGIVDPPLVDYLSALLVHCVRTDQLHGFRTAGGHVVREFGRLIEEAETRIGAARRRVHRYIGDLAMFWTGVFPESLRQTEAKSDLDEFGTYCLVGKRAYLLASSIPPESEDAAASDVLERLGLDFERCAYGLREVRRQWEDDATDPGSSLMG
ncbi:MAG: hypothetical protein ACQESR_10610 [Planctomycetota bacterium]